MLLSVPTFSGHFKLAFTLAVGEGAEGPAARPTVDSFLEMDVLAQCPSQAVKLRRASLVAGSLIVRVVEEYGVCAAALEANRI